MKAPGVLSLLLLLSACSERRDLSPLRVVVSRYAAPLQVRSDDGWEVAPEPVDGVVTVGVSGETLTLFDGAFYFAMVGEFEQIDRRRDFELLTFPDTPTRLEGQIPPSPAVYWVNFSNVFDVGSNGSYALNVPLVTADLIAVERGEGGIVNNRVVVVRDFPVDVLGTVRRDLDVTGAPALELSPQAGGYITTTRLNTGTTQVWWPAESAHVALPASLRRASDVYEIATSFGDYNQGGTIREWVDLPRAQELPANPLEAPTVCDMTLGWTWQPDFALFKTAVSISSTSGYSGPRYVLDFSPRWLAKFDSVDIERLLEPAGFDPGADNAITGAMSWAWIQNFDVGAEPQVGSRQVEFRNTTDPDQGLRQQPSPSLGTEPGLGRWADSDHMGYRW